MINLLPYETKKNRAYAVRNVAITRIIGVFGMVLGTLLLMYATAYLGLLNTAKATEKAVLDKQSKIADLSTIKTDAQKIADTIDTAAQILARETRFSELLQKIGALLPVGSSLKTLSLTGDYTKPLEITAVVAYPEQAPILQKNLLSGSLFATADIVSVDSVVKSDASGQPTQAFETTTKITATFKKELTTKTPATETQKIQVKNEGRSAR
jgi:Tfp pilus assembly protein PilN